MKIHIGTNLFPQHKGRIFKNYELTEVKPFYETKPHQKTLKNWRTESGKDFRFIIPAPLALTDPEWKPGKTSSWKTGAQGFTPGTEMEYIWKMMHKTAGILRSHTFVFVTPSSFRPTQSNIAKLTDFFKNHDRKNVKMVWEPHGLWDKSTILEVADNLDLYLSSDPVSTEFTDQPAKFRFFRINNFRSGGKLNFDDYYKIYESAQGSKRTFVLFSSPLALKNAKSFQDFMKNKLYL